MQQRLIESQEHRLYAFSPREIEDADKHTMYIFIRRDIGPEQQAVQSAHAAAEAGRLYYDPEHGIASLIILEAQDEADLAKISHHLEKKGIAFTAFFEPDFGMGYSALATRPIKAHERKYMMGWRLFRMGPQKEAA